tara:strand:+ start:467 stop:721 length:255 start_codon:yes stop_codon:yes gene_type:complete
MKITLDIDSIKDSITVTGDMTGTFNLTDEIFNSDDGVIITLLRASMDDTDKAILKISAPLVYKHLFVRAPDVSNWPEMSINSKD